MMTTYANPPSQKASTLASFKKKYPGAEQISWTKEKRYDKASFSLNNHRVIAYYAPNGEFIGSMRSIFFDELPLLVMKALEKKYSLQVILDISEITNPEGTFYRLIIEKKNKRYRVRLTDQGEVLETSRKHK